MPLRVTESQKCLDSNGLRVVLEFTCQPEWIGKLLYRFCIAENPNSGMGASRDCVYESGLEGPDSA